MQTVMVGIGTRSCGCRFLQKGEWVEVFMACPEHGGLPHTPIPFLPEADDPEPLEMTRT